MNWKRYRFQTNSVDDPRPLIFNPRYPYWITGEAGDGSFTTIVAYLPEGEDLYKYWDDAQDVDFQEREEITFTSRFPKPDYLLEIEKEDDDEPYIPEQGD